MISVKKDFSNPPVLLTNEILSYSIPSVQAELEILYNGKCAYCESKPDRLFTDHYRSPLNYPWLANEWSNLLPACRGCTTAKGDKFPISGTLVRKEQAKGEVPNINSELLLSEKPLLIHPEGDTAENHFSYTKDGLISGYTNRGRETIRILNLNRSELIAGRKKVYDYFYEKLKQSLQAAVHKQQSAKKNSICDANFFNELIDASKPSSEFSGYGQILCYQFKYTLLSDVKQELDLELHVPTDDEIEKIKSTSDFDEIEPYNAYESNGLYSKLLSEYYYAVFNVSVNGRDESPNQFQKLINFSILNYQGIHNIQFNGIPIDNQWIFLTGENGFGKTSILKAILLGFIGTEKGVEVSDKSRIDVDFAYIDDSFFLPIDMEKTQITRNTLNSDYFKYRKAHIAAYGASRTNLSEEIDELPIAANLFGLNDEVLNIEKKLINISDVEEFLGYKEAIIEALLKLIPRLAKVEVSVNLEKVKKEVLYYEKDEEGNILPPVSFKELAHGMRSVIALVGDIILRIFSDNSFQKRQSQSQSQSSGEHKTKPDKVSFSDKMSGIVIIDEFDSHLHPKWQRDLVQKLSELFPKIQFIVSTHSPIPLLGAPVGKTVILNVNRTKEEGVTVTRLDDRINFEELLPNAILTSPIFGFDDIISSQVR